MGAEVGVEDPFASELGSGFPGIITGSVALPVDEVESTMRSMIVVKDGLWNEQLLVLDVDGRRGILSLTFVAGGVGKQERDVEDGMDLEGRREFELESNVRQDSTNAEGTDVAGVELDRGTGGGKVLGRKPGEISDCKQR